MKIKKSKKRGKKWKLLGGCYLLIIIGFVGVGSEYILICTVANEKTQNNVSKAETLVIKNTKTTFYNNFDKIVIK